MSLRLALLLLLALPGHAWKVGPMPDFAPLGEVVAHRYIESRAPKLVPALRQQLGRRFRLETWTPCPDGSCDDLKLSWMRDYTPTFVRRRDGDLAVRTWYSTRPVSDGYGPEVWRRPELVALPHEHVPLVLVNGNLVTTGADVFVSELLFEDNGVPRPDLFPSAYRPRPPEVVVHMLAAALELPEERIHVLPSMPGEATQHIDLVVLPLGPKLLLVPEIELKGLAFLGDSVAHEARRYLDDRAAQLRALGFKVVRAPMLPPFNIGELRDGSPRNIVFSPANSLLLNVGGKRSVLVPTLEMPGAPAELVRLERSYERRWASLFRRHGWTPRFVDATGLAVRVGLLRCASWPVPPLPKRGRRG